MPARLQAAALCAASSLLWTAGCPSPGGDPDADPGPDAFTGCFEGGMPAWAYEAGEVEIGTGRDEFEAIAPEQDLSLVQVEGQFLEAHFDIRPRLRGLHPGNLEDRNSPDNPHTLASAYDEAGERLDVHEFGYTMPYRGDEEPFDLGYPRRLRMGASAAQSIDGERVRIVVEVLDSASRYAKAEVWVRARSDISAQ